MRSVLSKMLSADESWSSSFPAQEFRPRWQIGQGMYGHRCPPSGRVITGGSCTLFVILDETVIFAPWWRQHSSSSSSQKKFVPDWSTALKRSSSSRAPRPGWHASWSVMMSRSWWSKVDVNVNSKRCSSFMCTIIAKSLCMVESSSSASWSRRWKLMRFEPPSLLMNLMLLAAAITWVSRRTTAKLIISSGRRYKLMSLADNQLIKSSDSKWILHELEYEILRDAGLTWHFGAGAGYSLACQMPITCKLVVSRRPDFNFNHLIIPTTSTSINVDQQIEWCCCLLSKLMNESSIGSQSKNMHFLLCRSDEAGGRSITVFTKAWLMRLQEMHVQVDQPFPLMTLLILHSPPSVGQASWAAIPPAS